MIRSVIGPIIIFGSTISLAVYAMFKDSHDRKLGLKKKIVSGAINDSEIVGDGAWLTTQAGYPKSLSARVRDIEPMGM
jgi:hypothetical protein